MTGAAFVDDLFASFSRGLPVRLRTAADGLCHALGLGPEGTPWSTALANDPTVWLPASIAEAMPSLPPAARYDAAVAQLLATIETAASREAETSRKPRHPDVEAVLWEARKVRNEAWRRIAALDDAEAASECEYDSAELEVRVGLAAERQILSTTEPVTFSCYMAVSLAKQKLATPAAIRLAKAAGWNGAKMASAGRLAESIALGWQLRSDLENWENDFRRQGSWVTSLALDAQPKNPNPRDRPTAPASLRHYVLMSGVVGRMSLACARCFRAARRRATSLGAKELARWALVHERAAAERAIEETAPPKSRVR